MGGRRKSRDPEQHKSYLEDGYGGCTGGDDFGRRVRQGECQKCKCGRHYDLHCHDPPPLGLYDVDKRAPYGLDDPWEVKHACIQCHISLRHAHIVEHDHRYVVDYKIGDAFSKVKGRYPPPGISVFHKFPKSVFG